MKDRIRRARRAAPPRSWPHGNTWWRSTTAQGKLLAEAGREDDIVIPLPPGTEIPSDQPLLFTIVETDDLDDRHRLAVRRATIEPFGVEYVIVVGSSLEPTDEELESLRGILAYVVPMSLVVAGIGGWFLAGRSLSPVVSMADRARRIGIENLSERLPVANPRDELGLLAGTFNALLARLEAAVVQQRQFMADASHELRTPVTIARTAASVALQQPTRGEADYRETLEIIEQETTRLSRIVDDLFTLTRADAGSHPVRQRRCTSTKWSTSRPRRAGGGDDPAGIDCGRGGAPGSLHW